MVPFKRPAAEKSGIPVYQPGATAYQQLMQPYVPVSCEYPQQQQPPPQQQQLHQQQQQQQPLLILAIVIKIQTAIKIKIPIAMQIKTKNTIVLLMVKLTMRIKPAIKTIVTKRI